MSKNFDKVQNELLLYLIENLQNQNKMHIERTTAFQDLLKRYPQIQTRQQILFDLQNLNNKKVKMDLLFENIQTNFLRHISLKSHESQSISNLDTLKINGSLQSGCYYQRSIEDCHSVYKSNDKDNNDLLKKDKAFSVKNQRTKNFEYFGKIALPYEPKYPYKLNKHIYYFKQNLSNKKIESKYFTTEFTLMHWIEYYHFVHNKLPSDSELHAKLKSLELPQQEVQKYLRSFKDRNQIFLNGLFNQTQ